MNRIRKRTLREGRGRRHPQTVRPFRPGSRKERSIPRIAGRSRERDRVAHIGKAADMGERALKAEAETRMPRSAMRA